MVQVTLPVLADGLGVSALVGLDGTTTSALHSAGHVIPTPVSGHALLDTCSDLTALARGLLQKLGLKPVAQKRPHTAGGVITVDLFEVSLSIVDPSRIGTLLYTCPSLVVSELPVSLPDADLVIGLDVLLEGKLVLDGPSRRFTLEF